MTNEMPSQPPTRGPFRSSDPQPSPVPPAGTAGGRPTGPALPNSATSETSDGMFANSPNSPDGVGHQRWQFAIGDVIAERYRVDKVLGQGGMAEVYAVFDQLKKEARALKIMSTRLRDLGNARDRFISESQADLLRHPHIVRTIDLGEWKQKQLLYITMELLDGISLRAMLNESGSRNQTIPWKTALLICYQVCQALDFAHQQGKDGVVHRDIKPDNVLVRVRGNDVHAWVTDFGIARLQFDAAPSLHTVGGMGTPKYVAPEQSSNAAEVTGQADVYSVGVMLYELLTGRLPEGVFENASSLVSGLPGEIDEVIRQAMAGNPERRTVSAAILGAQIGRLLKESGQSLPRPAARTPPAHHCRDGGSSRSWCTAPASGSLCSTRTRAC